MQKIFRYRMLSENKAQPQTYTFSLNTCTQFIFFYIYLHVFGMYIKFPFFFLLLQSFQQDDQPSHSQIQEAASTIVSTLSKRHNSTVMLAVIEVKVEMPVTSQPVGEQSQLASRLKPDFIPRPSVNSLFPAISAA